MTGFFYGIADFFNALFSILPALGRGANILFIALGFVANFIWIRYMINRQNEEKGFNQ